MQLNLEKSAESTLIRHFYEADSGSEILIGEDTYRSSIILSPAGISLWDIANLNELGIDDFQSYSALVLGFSFQIPR